MLSHRQMQQSISSTVADPLFHQAPCVGCVRAYSYGHYRHFGKVFSFLLKFIFLVSKFLSTFLNLYTAKLTDFRDSSMSFDKYITISPQPLVKKFISSITLKIPDPIPDPGHNCPYNFFPFLDYKWNHMLCSLLGLNTFETNPYSYMHQYFFIFFFNIYFWAIFHYIDIQHFFYPSINWECLVCFPFEYLWIKPCKYLQICFRVDWMLCLMSEGKCTHWKSIYHHIQVTWGIGRRTFKALFIYICNQDHRKTLEIIWSIMSSLKAWQQISGCYLVRMSWGCCAHQMLSTPIREYIFSDYQMMFGCSRDLTLSLGVPRGSRSQLLEDSQHEG